MLGAAKSIPDLQPFSRLVQWISVSYFPLYEADPSTNLCSHLDSPRTGISHGLGTKLKVEFPATCTSRARWYHGAIVSYQMNDDRQLNDQQRKTEDDIQREKLGPRGVPGAADPAKMTPQREKKTPAD